MPQLQEATPDIKQFYLPSTAKQVDGTDTPIEEQAFVKMDVGNMLGGDFMDVMGSMDEGEANSANLTGQMLAARIKEWNFTGADGTTVEISYQNVRRMQSEDLVYLLGQLTGSVNKTLNVAQKKS